MKIKKFNCAPRLDETVSLLTREQVRDIFINLESKIVDQVFLVDDLVNTLGTFISKRFRVHSLHARAFEVESNELNINAFYDPELDEKEKVSIEIILVTNPTDDFLILDKEGWNLFLNRLADSLTHELIHMQQARQRQFLYVENRARMSIEVDEQLAYLSDLDEIDAYSHNIATELKEHQTPLKKLIDPKQITISDSVNLWAYLQAFEYKTSEPVIRRLLKKVYKHLTK